MEARDGGGECQPRPGVGSTRRGGVGHLGRGRSLGSGTSCCAVSRSTQSEQFVNDLFVFHVDALFGICVEFFVFAQALER